MRITDVLRDWNKEATLAKELAVYEIVIQDHLATRRFQQFEGLAVTHQPNGETRLVGSIPDQAALYGLLNWLRDLGASLVSVKRLEGSEGTRERGGRSGPTCQCPPQP
jgi:hypothetical protein